ncbi:hypothetical protein DRW41_03745 [Neobacillus piezotolerans]|uniref:Uncharacterized protein n=1 Tax=Neobacillus piezotolerans TaxID=2259171 RepID=A0A3D8GW49_9BACI|nr:hypothetical protein [Neobacillus piezotolerans]RDU38684.1 hypothetical protein DRW41_03745 [Neobacillus piezotolerans]
MKYGDFTLLNSKRMLKDALWSFWISEDVPTGTNIPMLAKAFEILKKCWFKSTKTKSKGIHIPKKEFEQLLGGDFKAIEQTLQGHEYADRPNLKKNKRFL